ncbi:MAG: hypothetical protein DRO67_08230 [Candidatus Asgardarchaeum californiense]|nr:MAG: hypothetical protein DRO67_08230 [Candidatus Asgardarchaeum californiense]
MAEMEESKSEEKKDASLEEVIEKLKESLSTLSTNIRDTIVYLGRLRESVQSVMNVLPKIEALKSLAEKLEIAKPPVTEAPTPPTEAPPAPPVEQKPVPSAPSMEPPKPEKPISIPAPAMPTVSEPVPPKKEPTVRVDATSYFVNEALNEVVRVAQNGAPAEEVAKLLINARDKIMQKVPYSLAYHEMRSFASKLEELKTAPLPSGLLTELIEKVEEWKRRLSK